MAVPGNANVSPASDAMQAPNTRKIPIAVRPRGDIAVLGVVGGTMGHYRPKFFAVSRLIHQRAESCGNRRRRAEGPSDLATACPRIGQRAGGLRDARFH